MVATCLVPPVLEGWDQPSEELTLVPVKQQNDDVEGNGSSGPFSRWFTWGHLGVTVALCGLLYMVWSDTRKHDVADFDNLQALSSRVSVIENDIRHQVSTDREQNDALRREVAVLVQRIDAQRSDIREMQSLLIKHIDTSSFRRQNFRPATAFSIPARHVTYVNSYGTYDVCECDGEPPLKTLPEPLPLDWLRTRVP